MNRRTDELQHGDRVRLPGGIIRTVGHWRPIGYTGHTGRPIIGVYYVEGRTPEWSEGNSGTDETLWNIEPNEAP